MWQRGDIDQSDRRQGPHQHSGQPPGRRRPVKKETTNEIDIHFAATLNQNGVLCHVVGALLHERADVELFKWS